MASVKRLCVYCGSSDRVAAAYREAARRLGTILAAAGSSWSMAAAGSASWASSPTPRSRPAGG